MTVDNQVDLMAKYGAISLTHLKTKMSKEKSFSPRNNYAARSIELKKQRSLSGIQFPSQPQQTTIQQQPITVTQMQTSSPVQSNIQQQIAQQQELHQQVPQNQNLNFVQPATETQL